MTTSELIAKLERRLAEAQRVTAHRREAECANEIEGICREMLADLYARRSLTRSSPPPIRS